jgi:hypothetical protein
MFHHLQLLPVDRVLLALLPNHLPEALLGEGTVAVLNSLYVRFHVDPILIHGRNNTAAIFFLLGFFCSSAVPFVEWGCNVITRGNKTG